MGELWDALYEDDTDESTAPVVVVGQISAKDLKALTAAKPGPVVNKRKREGIQLCKVFDPAKPPKWGQTGFEGKFDGYRCEGLVQNGAASLLTSTGLPHYNIEHVKAQMEAAAQVYPDWCDNVMLDGELMHETLDFDTAGGILRASTTPNPEAAKGFVFHVWDALHVQDFLTKQCAETLQARKVRLATVVNLMGRHGDRVVEVEYKVGQISDIELFAREYVIEDGLEGIVAKRMDGMYQFKKSGVWLKWKPKFDGDLVTDMKEGDFRITGGKPGRGKHRGRLGAIYIEGYLLEDGNIQPDPPDDGSSVIQVTGKAGTGFNDAERIQFQAWQDAGTLAGRCVECHYQEISPENSLRFPVFVRLRPDKDE